MGSSGLSAATICPLRCANGYGGIHKRIGFQVTLRFTAEDAIAGPRGVSGQQPSVPSGSMLPGETRFR
jgi:hypothetical protein